MVAKFEYQSSTSFLHWISNRFIMFLFNIEVAYVTASGRPTLQPVIAP